MYCAILAIIITIMAISTRRYMQFKNEWHGKPIRFQDPNTAIIWFVEGFTRAEAKAVYLQNDKWCVVLRFNRSTWVSLAAKQSLHLSHLRTEMITKPCRGTECVQGNEVDNEERRRIAARHRAAQKKR